MTWDKQDRAWASLIKERDGWACRRCGRIFAEGNRRGLDAHHIFTKTRRSTRHVLLNGVALCTGHHIAWAHREPLEFHEWIKAELGADEYDELQRISRKTLKEVIAETNSS